MSHRRAVATEALPYIARRPLKLVRHERGTTYYHKGRLPPVPETVRQLHIQKREGGTGTRLWVNDLDALLGLIDMGVVELHAWNCTVDDIEHADLMMFDLNPGPGVGMGMPVEIAVDLRERCCQAIRPAGRELVCERPAEPVRLIMGQFAVAERYHDMHTLPPVSLSQLSKPSRPRSRNTSKIPSP